MVFTLPHDSVLPQFRLGVGEHGGVCVPVLYFPVVFLFVCAVTPPCPLCVSFFFLCLGVAK